MKCELHYKGSVISEWDISESWMPNYGQLLFVKYNGKLTPFRAMGMPTFRIIVLLLDEEVV